MSDKYIKHDKLFVLFVVGTILASIVLGMFLGVVIAKRESRWYIEELEFRVYASERYIEHLESELVWCKWRLGAVTAEADALWTIIMEVGR